MSNMYDENAPIATAALNTESPCILIVDDTPANLTLLQDMLRTQDYRVLAFPAGRMALNAAAKNPPDLIL